MIRGLPGLVLVAVVAAVAVTLTWQLAQPRIEANRVAYQQRSLERVIPGVEHDGRLGQRRIDVQARDQLGEATSSIWFAVNADEVVALIVETTAPDGYSGPIRMLLGLDTAGRVLGIEILEHRETPGLGDVIEPRRSDWLQQFTGRALDDPERERWRLARHDGAFDGVTGATITTRAVTRALRRALIYFDTNRDDLFEQARALPEEPADDR